MKWNKFGLNMAVPRSEAIEGSGGSDAAPAPASESPADRMGVSPEVRAVFDFDPFEPGAESATAPVTEAPTTTPEVPVAAPSVAPAETPSSPSAMPPPEPLQTAVNELRQTIQQLPEAVRQAAPAAPPPQTPEADPWIPRDGEQPLNYMNVMSQIPDAVLHNLGSENLVERKQAVAQLMGISMHIAHRSAMRQSVEMIRREMGQVLPNFVTEQIRNYDTAQRVYTDFYGKYPQLSAPHFRPIVQQEAARLSQQLGVSGWTPEFRDQLGKHVLGMLGQVAPQATVQPAAPATQTMGPSVRPAMANGGYTQGQDMADLLGL